MATQYTSILKLALPTQGELSGTWGDVVNSNITSMIEEAIAGRSVINSWAANSHTLTTADGLTSESRAAMLEFTDTGTLLSGAATVVCPTATKIYVCKNAAGQTVTVKTAAGTGVDIPNGETMFVFCDGTNVVQAVTSLTTLKVGTGIQVSTILDEDNMASDSATALATQQSIKAYVDAQVTAQDVDFAGDTGTGAVDLDSQTFTVAGTANEIETSASGQTITIGLPTAIVVTTITTTNVQATNIKANDGTAAITIADSTGQVTVTDAVLTTADINGGTADNVTIGGSTAAAGSFTTLGASGTTTLSGALALTGNLDINTNKFNVTAVDGNTLIAGTLGVTGNVDINGGTIDDTVIGGTTAAAGTFTTGQFNTSVNVDGTVTADGLTVDASEASILGGSSTSGSDTTLIIGSGTNTSDSTHGIQFRDRYGAASFPDGQIGAFIQAERASSAADYDLVLGTTTSNATDAVQRLRISDDGDISFYEDTGTTAKLYWDASAESLGIGTVDPIQKLHVFSAGVQIAALVQSSSTNTARLALMDANTTASNYVNVASSGNNLAFYAGAAERMRIDSSGNVGIGTSSPASIVGGTDTSPVLSIGGTDTTLTTGDKAGSISFITSDGSYTNTYADGVTAEIASVSETSTGAAYGLAMYTGTITGGNRAERLRIDREGNVGIGTSSPTAKLEVAGTTTAVDARVTTTTGRAAFRLASTGGVFGTFLDDSAGNSFGSAYSRNIYSNGAYPLRIWTNDLERVRIDSSGNLLVGTTSAISNTANTADGFTFSPSDGFAWLSVSDAGGVFVQRQNNNRVFTFLRGSTIVGSISVTASTTAYNTSSDQRLKENITDAPAGNIDDIKVRSFDWKVDGSHQEYGMVSQELEAVAPYAVTKGETEDDMWSVDYSKLVPMLIKEIQDLKAEVAALKGAN